MVLHRNFHVQLLFIRLLLIKLIQKLVYMCVLYYCSLGVPVCSDFCDNWFDACKTDQICVENVLEDYNFTVHGENFCPANKSCITYEAMYGNGKNLCEKMWGGSYKYTKANDDYSNCLLMDGSTPPTKKPTVDSKGFVNKACALLVFLFALAAVQ